ncbi:MAG: hypothetical protein KAU95_00345, partial [Candidatus Aenigmarchaeota archaeon]|nr:hypothetical protein [Candidatus Aenigmarchaeota archaeon]
AEKLNLEGICIVSGLNNLENNLEKIKTLNEKSELNIATGVMIKEDIEKKSKELRRKVELIFVSGGDYEINRTACSSHYVDILCHPNKGRYDCGIDHVCCNEAKAHNTVIELNFRELLTAQGMEKIRELNKLKNMLRLCIKTKANFIVNSGAVDIFELRSGRELSALSFTLGATLYDALAANSEIPRKLIAKNREKMNQPLKGVN